MVMKWCFILELWAWNIWKNIVLHNSRLFSVLW